MRSFLPIAGLGIGQVFIWAGTFYFFPALLAVWEADLGWSKPSLSLGFTLSLGVSALVSPLAGQLIDRGHGRWVLSSSALLCAAMLVALSQVQTLWGFYAVWIAMGVGMAGGLYEPCFAFLIWAMGSAARRAITTVTLVAGFAGTVSFPTANLLAEYRDWRFACLAFAAVNAFVVAPIFWAAARSVERAAVGKISVAMDRRGGLGAAVRSPVFWLIGATVLFIALAHGMMITHLLSMLAEAHVAKRIAVLAASMIGPMQVAGRIVLAVAGGNVSAMAGTTGYLVGLAAGYVMLFAAGVERNLAGTVRSPVRRGVGRSQHSEAACHPGHARRPGICAYRRFARCAFPGSVCRRTGLGVDFLGNRGLQPHGVGRGRDVVGCAVQPSACGPGRS